MNEGFGKLLLWVEGLYIERYLRGRRTQSLKRGYGNESQRSGYGDILSDGPIAWGRLLVAITRTFFLFLSLSSCVKSALTTCMCRGCVQSDG